ncbi:amino acid adenylation domain-containing protein [Nostoc sp. C052]|uniref:non-ribosomal peptide synthetase n=1 Tax=Nostoc sp. C052 TaxID=2576902 RepID=UPI0015C3AAF9|nr:non-ribosomal peptide synthetase [Nostoc sp. C052]QLE40496.1 amino acid adenylation domain-containing protein [Nostoc sp. C052]
MKQNNIEDIYELSPMQQGMLFHKLAAPNSIVYFEQACFRLQTQLNVSAFQKAWQRVVDRHPILRTSFYWDNLDKPYQVVHQQVNLPYVFQDWRQLSFQEQQKQLKAFLKADGDRGFELSQAPLIRLTLIQVDDNTYEFVFSFHHILMEGWSVTWLWKEFYEFYNAFCQGQDLHLERPRPYREYITWLQQQDLNQAEAFWRQKLKEFTLPTPIIVGKSSASFSDQKGGYQRQDISVSATTTTALKSFARKHQLTLNILMKGAWALLLNRYSQESDIVFGSTSSGRPTALADAESMIGLFINTLPLRVQLQNNAYLSPWLKNLQAEEVQMREYEYSPLLKIQQWSEIPRGLQLFDSILVFDNELVDYNQGAIAQSLGVVESQLLGESQSLFDWTNYPLTVKVVPKSDLLNLCISYDTHRFDSATITQMLGHFQTLLESIVSNPEQRICDLQLLTSSEIKQLLVEWNDTKIDYAEDKCIHKLFEEQVERTPDAVAAFFENQQLTYRELNNRANQLAHYLQQLGVKPEVLVGICIERSSETLPQASLDMVIGLLAILKAGGAYIPIDPNYPQERIAFILEDTQTPVLLTQASLLETIPHHKAQVICLDTDWHLITQQSQENVFSEIAPDNLAYVIYTSGSTGKPKGVMIKHANTVAMLDWAKQTFTIEALQGVLASTSICFDLSVFELFVPLCCGGKVILMENALYLPTLPTAQNVTLINTVPSVISQLLRTNSIPASVQTINVAGEPLHHHLVQQLYQQENIQQVFNLYGPSEDTTYSTFALLDKDTSNIPPIGRPIHNTQIYLLDQNLQPVPVGVTGMLYIGGAGLSRGYLNKPELTAERFIPNPYTQLAGERLYQTGDLGRYLPNGEIEYIGRIDYQVKVRGFRIELLEIEALIIEHPEVREAVVTVDSSETDSQRIVAYVVPNSEQTLTISQLRDFLEAKLPNYMVPTAFVFLESLPLTPNGKIDRKALKAPDTVRPELEVVYQPPQTEVEKTITDIWQKVLNLEKVGIHDNFFELGGHSLLLVQVHSKLQKRFQRDFLLVEMFQYPTVSHLARYFSQESREETSFIKHSENRTASVQRRKQARKEHREITKERGVS